MFRDRLKLFTTADLLLVLIILVVSVLSGFMLLKNQNKLTAYIYYKNNLIGTYALSEPKIIEINADCTAEIRDGKIRMLQSDCPDKLCVKQSWSNLVPIVCLPNQIVIEIKSPEQQQIHILH